jgi:hypothetical protein
LGKHPRRALGCQRIGKTLAFYGVKAGCRRKEIETVTLGVAGDDSRGAAENFDDIGVGHEGFLPLASVRAKGHQLTLIAPAICAGHVPANGTQC